MAQKWIRKLLASAAMILALPSHPWANGTDFDVNITFKPSQCQFIPDSRTLFIEQNASLKDLRAGVRSVSVPFILSLQDCSEVNLDKMRITFQIDHSVPLEDGITYLALDKTSSAGGVVIGLEDSQRNRISFNTQLTPPHIEGQGEERTVKFWAFLQRDGGEVKPGPYQAKSVAIISYL